MKTAIVLFAAALSVAALSTNASAQKGFSSPKAVAAEKLTDKNSNSSTKSKNPIKSSDIHGAVNTSNILVPKPRRGKEQVEIATPELVANVGALCCPGGTTFMTSDREGEGYYSGGGGGRFKLTSETDEANPNDSPGPWSGYSTAEKPSKIVQPTTGLLFADFMNGSGGSSSDDAYALIASLIGIAVTAGEADEHGETEPAAATAIEYGLIASLTSNGPDVIDTVYAEPEFE